MPEASTATLSAVPAPKPYLPALTGVRAVAAYLVFLHHFNPFAAIPSWKGISAWVTEFHVGVPIFFVLSGFLITLRYATNDFSHAGHWFRYLATRFVRIYPLYLLVVVLTYTAFWRANHFSVRDFLFSISLSQGLFEQMKYVGVSQAWSLTAEECFYLFAPLCFWLSRRRVPLWLQSLALVLLGSGLVAAFSPVASLLLGFMGSVKFMLLFTFFGYGFTFLVGSQLAHWYQRNQLITSLPTGLITYVGIALFVLVLTGLVGAKGGRDHGFESWSAILLYNVALPITIALFFAGLLTERTWVQQLLSSRLLDILGKSSYAFYLVHYGVIRDWLALHVTAHNGALFIGLNLLAIGLHYGVEKPLYGWLKPSATLPSRSKS